MEHGLEAAGWGERDQNTSLRFCKIYSFIQPLLFQACCGSWSQRPLRQFSLLHSELCSFSDIIEHL